MIAVINNDFKLDVVSVRLVKDAPILSDIKITTPDAAVELLGKYLCEMDREVLCVVNLKSDNTPINCTMVSIGALNQSIANPREMLKASILSNAANMILIHNHPSGNLQPSKEDISVTDRMIKLTGLVGITLLDHIIIGGNNIEYFSMREKKLMRHERECLSRIITILSLKAVSWLLKKKEAGDICGWKIYG